MLKKLAKCLREYKAVTIFTMLCMVVEAAMEVLIPLLIFRFGKCVQPTGGGSPDIDGMIRDIENGDLFPLSLGCSAENSARRRLRGLPKTFVAICSGTSRVFRLRT